MSDSVLVVAAHPDDEVLGCGGAIARHAARGDRVTILLLGEGATSRGPDSASDFGTPDELRAAARGVAKALGVSRLEMSGLPDNRFDTVPLLEIIRLILPIYAAEQPALVYTHHPGDVNIDHEITYRSMLAVCRQMPGSRLRGLYHFEVPSSSEWQTPAAHCPFVPNHFVDIAPYLPLKITAMELYASEARAWPHPRSPQALQAIARWRGATVGLDAAEAFVVGRQVQVD